MTMFSLKLTPDMLLYIFFTFLGKYLLISFHPNMIRGAAVNTNIITSAKERGSRKQVINVTQT